MEFQEQVTEAETTYRVRLDQLETNVFVGALKLYCQQPAVVAEMSYREELQTVRILADTFTEQTTLRWTNHSDAGILDEFATALEQYSQGLAAASAILRAAGMAKPSGMSDHFRVATELMIRFSEEAAVNRLHCNLNEL